MSAPKTIAVNEAAYRTLERLKREGESFSDVIIRRFRGGGLSQFAGAWADEPAEDIEAMREQLLAMRKRSDEKARERMGLTEG